MAYRQRKLALNAPANDLTPAPASRLRAAVKSIEDAYTEQSRQIKHYQACNKELGATMDKLQRSLESYLDSLDRIDVSRLNRRARRLARIAGRWQSVSG